MRFHGHGVLGWNLVDKARHYQNEEGCIPMPNVRGFAIDLSPHHANEVPANPQQYTDPAWMMTVRFSKIMRLFRLPMSFNERAGDGNINDE